MTRPRASSYLVALVPVLLWGASFIAWKVALRSMSPLGLVTGRALLGCLVLGVALAMSRKERRDEPLAGDAFRIGVLAVLGVLGQSWIQAHALLLTSAIHSGWLVTLIPVFTAVLSSIFLGERFPALKAAGVATGLLGALVVVRARTGAAIDLPATSGDFLILLSALNWSIYTLVARGLFVRRDPLLVTAKAMGAGAALLVVLYAVSGEWRELGAVTPEGLLMLAFLGIGCTGIAYLAWSEALARFEPGTLTSFQYLQPLVTVAGATLLLHEPVGASVLLGGALALLGVFLVQRGAVAPDRPRP
jgi:drug/metabolite transporter (DMT)-like permease